MTPETALDTQVITLDEVGQLGVSLFAPSESPPLMMSGEAYAYDRDSLVGDAASWHWTLMRAALIGLDIQRGRGPLIAGYDVAGDLVRLFLCAAKDLTIKERTHRSLAQVPGYVECGRDAVAVSQFRPVAYWEPPDTLVALWRISDDRRPTPRGVSLPATRTGRLDSEDITYVNRWAELRLP